MDMKRWQKITVAVSALAVVAGGLAYLNRKALILYAVTHVERPEIGPNVPVVWAQGPVTASMPAAQRPPNIIFILADDLGINDISTFGGGLAGGRLKTPNIDSLAAQGALFDQAYAGNGTCAPSRAMLMTGRYPTRTGYEFTPTPDGMGRIVKMFADGAQGGRPPVAYNRDVAESAPSYADQGLPGSEITLAEVLKTRGYRTAHIGKWHLGDRGESSPNAQGFDESLLMANGLHLPENAPNVVNAKLASDPIDKFLWARMQFAAAFNGGKLFEPAGYLADYWTDESIKYIEANKNRPFFLYLAHWGIHTPLQATKADFDAVGDIRPHRLRVYAAMTRALDRSVGRIVEKLKQAGLSDNTIIVFSSDNGGAGYIDIPDVNKPYRGWKLTLFEGGIKVPMFVKWPARIRPGTHVTTPVAHIDVMPTLAGAGGAALPEGVEIDGRDMMPAAMGKGRITRPNDALFWQSGYNQVVRAGDWKLLVDGKQNKNWLFNLKTDPTERTNLAVANASKVADLKALLAAHHKGRKPALYPYTLESAITIDKTAGEPFVKGDEVAWWPN